MFAWRMLAAGEEIPTSHCGGSAEPGSNSVKPVYYVIGKLRNGLP